MNYQVIIRKYRLPKSEETRYQLMKQWREIVEKGRAEDYLIDEFAVDDQKRVGWLGGLKKQLFG